ncbi:MAG: hypothetical protein LBU64_10810 [Planctomycetota bacterium]|jgi:hypothetical protein|nr:hypothetical protein [Planctomycetota bacterium]
MDSPVVKRFVVTNGILLRNVEGIIPLLIKTGTELAISPHPVPRSQANVLVDALHRADWWTRRGLILSVRQGNAGKKPYIPKMTRPQTRNDIRARP